MSKKFWLVVSLMLVAFGLAVFGCYYSGFGHWVRVNLVIGAIQNEKNRQRAWEIFNNEREGWVSGIYAGAYANKIGIWGRTGLSILTTDQYSVYRYIDGCSLLAHKTLETGGNGLDETLFFEMSGWKKRIKTGDYVTVMTTFKPAQGGTSGNARGIYTHNYWSFFEGENRTQCAK
jgi:hypothetical protein